MREHADNISSLTAHKTAKENKCHHFPEWRTEAREGMTVVRTIIISIYVALQNVHNSYLNTQSPIFFFKKRTLIIFLLGSQSEFIKVCTVDKRINIWFKMFWYHAIFPLIPPPPAEWSSSHPKQI